MKYSDEDGQDSRCVPVCQQWSPYAPDILRVTNILIRVITFSALLAGSIVLILGYIRRKRM